MRIGDKLKKSLNKCNSRKPIWFGQSRVMIHKNSCHLILIKSPFPLLVKGEIVCSCNLTRGKARFVKSNILKGQAVRSWPTTKEKRESADQLSQIHSSTALQMLERIYHSFISKQMKYTTAHACASRSSQIRWPSTTDALSKTRALM